MRKVETLWLGMTGSSRRRGLAATSGLCGVWVVVDGCPVSMLMNRLPTDWYRISKDSSFFPGYLPLTSPFFSLTDQNCGMDGKRRKETSPNAANDARANKSLDSSGPCSACLEPKAIGPCGTHSHTNTGDTDTTTPPSSRWQRRLEPGSHYRSAGTRKWDNLIRKRGVPETERPLGLITYLASRALV